MKHIKIDFTSLTLMLIFVYQNRKQDNLTFKWLFIWIVYLIITMLLICPIFCSLAPRFCCYILDSFSTRMWHDIFNILF